MPPGINALLLLVALALPVMVFRTDLLTFRERNLPNQARNDKQPTGNIQREVAIFSAEQVKEDLDYLYKTLDASHYNLYAHTRKAVFDKEYQRIEDSLHGPLTLHEINPLLQRFVALANIGHCNIGYYFGVYGGDDNTLFPFDVIVRGERVLISKNYSADSRFVPGDQLLSLEGKPIDAVLEETRKSIAGERTYLKDSSLEGISFPRLWWYAHGNSVTYRVAVKKKSGAIVSSQVEAVKARTFDKERGINIPCRLDRDFKIIDKQTAYLYPGPFFDFSGGKTYDNSTFLRFLESSFTEISKRKVRNLIIDLRNNPGGDNSFSDPMIAYFANKPFRFCSKYRLKTSRVLKDFWTKEVPKTLDKSNADLERMKQAILSHKDGESFEYEIADYNPRTDTLRFTGRVYVLINRHSYSNATCTAAIIQDYGFGELVGEETSDVPTSYASTASFELPNTRIKVTFPKGYFIRPSGDTKLKGVVPNHFVTEDPFTEEDEVLAYTLQKIRARE